MKILKTVSHLSVLLVVVSCNSGGGGGSSSIGGSTTISSQFIDSPVKGLDVEAEKSGKMKTGNQGRFNCESGESITFYLRDLKIGSTTCGESKIYLDDVVPSNNTADKFAAILQSLSKTGSSDLDLSHIPDEHKISDKVDFSDETSILSSIDTIKGDFPEVEFVPKVISLAAAREHVNQNLPELSAPNIAILDSLILNPKVVVGKMLSKTKTGEMELWCSDYFITEMRVKKDVNSLFTAELNKPQYPDGCDQGSSEDRCQTGWTKMDGIYGLDSWKSGLENKIIIGSKIKFNRTLSESFQESTEASVDAPVGAILSRTTKNGEAFEWNLFYPGADIPYIFNKNNFFPTKLETIDLFVWDYTVASGSSGTYEQNFSRFGVSNYVSATDYQIDNNVGKCVYELITPKDSDVHAADGVYNGEVTCNDDSSLTVSLTVNGYRGVLSIGGIYEGQIGFSNNSASPLDTPYLDYGLPDQSVINGEHNPGSTGPNNYSFNYTLGNKKCEGGMLVK